MDLNIVLIFLLLLSTLQLAWSFSIINDYSLLKIMFGNVTELKDLALPPMNQTENDKVEQRPGKNDPEYFKYDSNDIDEVFEVIPVDPKDRKYAYEVLEFNAIMESLSEVTHTHKTRRQFFRWPPRFVQRARDAAIRAAREAARLASLAAIAAESVARVGVSLASDGADYAYERVSDFIFPNRGYDSNYYRGREDSADKVKIEYKKLQNLDNLMVCLLIHTRYRVDHAIRQRKKSRQTKAYRLGYLFNRLRRVKYMQAKAVNTANVERIAQEKLSATFRIVRDNFGWQVVRWYEKMIHMDVDLRDLCNLVYDTLAEKEEQPLPKQNETAGK